MARLVLDYLEETVKIYPEKVAYIDRSEEITFRNLRERSFAIASELIERKIFKKPILIFLEKNVFCITAFMGVAYSGNFYSPIDTKMPMERIEKIIETLSPVVIITDEKHKEIAGHRSGS